MRVSGPKNTVDPLQLAGKKLLDRYSVEKRLASGGMSFVYRGQDERLQRAVCIKVFYTLSKDRAELRTGYEHFVQEAFALSQLQHPNTLRIYDFGYLDQEPQNPFYVSELMNGGTLSQRVREVGALTPAKALEVLEPIVQALAEAHGRGIIHRDIKPSNILFVESGPRRIAKLADFGIAKALTDSRPLPHRAQETNANGEGISMFSPGWAAPEQIRGRPVSPATDVFALGLTLAYMLSGRKIFAEDSYARNLNKRLDGDAFVQSALDNLDLSSAVKAVITRACRVAVAERFPTVETFYSAVKDVLRAPVRDPNVEPMTDPHVLTPQAPAQILSTLSVSELLVGGRVVRLVAISPRGTELGGEEDSAVVPSAARVRVTLMPAGEGKMRLHIKGLNCFVSRGGNRPTNAVDLTDDTHLQLRSPGKETLDAVRCCFGAPGPADVRVFPVGSQRVGMPAELASHAVLLDFGPGREAALAYSISGKRSDS
ncbi:MAG: serine/threonine-protein kinase [Myxococcaceae bacterium]